MENNIVEFPYDRYTIIERMVGEFEDPKITNSLKAQIGDIIQYDDNQTFYVMSIRDNKVFGYYLNQYR